MTSKVPTHGIAGDPVFSSGIPVHSKSPKTKKDKKSKVKHLFTAREVLHAKDVLNPNTHDASMAEIIKARCVTRNIPFAANNNIAAVLQDGDLENLQTEVRFVIEDLMKALVIDTKNDHNSQGTAERVSKMLMQELYVGRYTEMPDVTDFPNVSNLDQMYAVGPIQFNSTCSHHHVAIIGKAWVGVFPSKRVIGLSKFHRIANWVMRRPQIQEEATVMLADILEQTMKPRGLALMVKAKHHCCGVRGVQDPGTWMLTSVMRGDLRTSDTMKTEFMQMLSGLDFNKD